MDDLVINFINSSISCQKSVNLLAFLEQSIAYCTSSLAKFPWSVWFLILLAIYAALMFFGYDIELAPIETAWHVWFTI